MSRPEISRDYGKLIEGRRQAQAQLEAELRRIELAGGVPHPDTCERVRAALDERNAWDEALRHVPAFLERAA